MVKMLTTPEAIEEVVTKRNGKVYLVSQASRIVVPSFVAAIEWYWYTPYTSRNRLFDVYAANWQDELWSITAFPEGRLDAVRRLAKQLGLRISNGPPGMMIGSRGRGIFAIRPSEMRELEQWTVHFFPGSTLPNGTDNLFVHAIEYDNKNPVYQNKKNDRDTMHHAGIEVNDMLNKGIKLTPSQIADYIYGTGEITGKTPLNKGG